MNAAALEALQPGADQRRGLRFAPAFQLLVVDSQGNVYVADTGNDVIQELDPNGTPPAVWGTADCEGVNGPG